MPGKRVLPLPEFKTPEEEAEFWAAHSSIDYMPMRLKLLKAERKQGHVSLRLSSRHQEELAELAGRYKVGPSAMARMILEAVLTRPELGKTLFSKPIETPTQFAYEAFTQRIKTFNLEPLSELVTLLESLQCKAREGNYAPDKSRALKRSGEAMSALHSKGGEGK